jgi:hypothetical protein
MGCKQKESDVAAARRLANSIAKRLQQAILNQEDFHRTPNNVVPHDTAPPVAPKTRFFPMDTPPP